MARDCSWADMDKKFCLCRAAELSKINEQQKYVCADEYCPYFGEECIMENPSDVNEE